MDLRIALAGNPNSGKTTLFNALTGSNQFVGNWPGVTVEKKEGKLKKHDGVIITDLPGIYSLSPYTLEEVVARNYLIGERPDAILNIIDGTNLERNLYLTTQLTELGIPVVIAVNMMDIVRKNGDKIDTNQLAKQLGCKVMEISALKGTGVMEAAEAAIDAAKNVKTIPMHTFSGPVEHAIAHIEEAVLHNMPEEQQRWYAIKVFERDDKVMDQLNIPATTLHHIESDIKAAETELDDDAESIITNERYVYIAEVIKSCYKKKKAGSLSTSDKIDKVVTNRWLGLPIFALIMFAVYWVAMIGVGAPATDFTNDCIFGDGFHLFNDGGYADIAEQYADASAIVDGYNAYVEENGAAPEGDFTYTVEDEETLEVSEETASLEDYEEAKATLDKIGEEPDPADYGIWVPGIPALVEAGLDAVNAADWLKGLVLDGIVAGVGAVLGFVPQMLVLFLMLAFLEACGYMARIAFVLDRIFRKFGLSGKSFIPMLVGVGCGVPGIMASRTIENERDRRMTIMTTTFIPCGAKVPFIAMISGAIFGGSAWVATSAYFIGMAAIIISGIMLKKTKMFAGPTSPFVMELPNYRMPGARNVAQLLWEKARDFLQKAFTVIFVATILIWFLQTFDLHLNVVSNSQQSLLAVISGVIAPLFAPMGLGDWRVCTALLTGFMAKESVVSTLSVLFGTTQSLRDILTPLSAVSLLVFCLLYTPCVAAISSVRRELGGKWACFVVVAQCVIAWIVAYAVYLLLGMVM